MVCRDYEAWQLSLLKLVMALSVLPYMASFLHLDHWLQSSEFCFVGPSSSEYESYHANTNAAMTEETLTARELFGIYRPNLLRKFHLKMVTSAFVLNQSHKQQIGPLQIITDAILKPQGYPSIMKLNNELLDADSKHSYSNVMLSFVPEMQTWCFLNREQKLCIETMQTDEEHPQPPLANMKFPPTGSVIMIQSKAAEISSHERSLYVSISCPSETSYNFFQWLITMIRSNPNLECLQNPATSFLMLVNIGLAFIYWNNHIEPSSVCIEYQKIIHNNELWRSFSGATAHFEPLHIGFNMMSLYALGSELEPNYGPIIFMFYNICLIPLTTVVMMTLVWLQIRWTGNERLKQTKTVGYSGVLFAWMVISSLERRSTCPVPFFPDLCFKTHEFGNTWKFNFGPLVQLIIAQMIMPRVSFVGHLAGIICGFILHWKILPREIFYSPQVLISLILLVSCRHIYKQQSSGTDDVENGNDVWGTPEYTNRNHKSVQLLNWIQKSVVAVALCSIFMFSLCSSLFLGQAITSTLVAMGCHLFRKRSKRDCAVLFKASIVSLLLLIAVDAMHLPYWRSLMALISSRWNVSSHVFLMIFFVIRNFVNFAALVVFSNILIEMGDINDGIFHYTAGWAVRTSHAVAIGMHQARSISQFSPFQGHGIALGSS